MNRLISFLYFSVLVAGAVVTDHATSVLRPRESRSIRKRNVAKLNTFNHPQTGSTLQFVQNSGVCEMTPDVQQYSGYLQVGNNMNMWFWFFEARNNSENAPIVAWFNGGPGCSSMIGLFQVRSIVQAAKKMYIF
jgi:carboxypeptidase C (cathepsin A)